MTNKIYVLRQIAYQFNDEYFYVHSPGAIRNIFDNETEARKVYQELEISALRACLFGQQRAVSINNDVPEKLHAYMQTIPGGSIFERVEPERDESELYVARRHYQIPSEVNDDQVLKIQEITGIRFYELSVFENEPVYFQIWLPRSKNYHGIPPFDTGIESEHFERTNYFFNTEESALEYASKFFRRRFSSVKLEGTFAELSLQPTLLESFVETQECVVYNKDLKTLELKYGVNQETIIGLNGLLKEPLFEIHEVLLADVRNYSHAPYEMP